MERGVVQPSYGFFRRALLPIYGMDQLAFFLVAGLPLIWLAARNTQLALYLAIGAYLGAVLSMQRSTPSSLLLGSQDEHRVVTMLDHSPSLKRTGTGNEWVSARSRLRRWNTDTIRLQHTPAGTLLTGRFVDLQTVAHQLKH